MSIKLQKKIKINRKKLQKLTPSKNAFLSLASSIIYQQISTKAGDAIYGRFTALFGKKKPTPELLLKIAESKLRSAGLSSSKVIYLRDLASKFIDKTISTKNFHKMSDQEVKDHLLQVKGIGPWTADMFLIFALNRENILPVGDLAIQKGFQRVFSLRKLPTLKQMHKLAEPHQGEHTYLALHLWKILDNE